MPFLNPEGLCESISTTTMTFPGVLTLMGIWIRPCPSVATRRSATSTEAHGISVPAGTSVRTVPSRVTASMGSLVIGRIVWTPRPWRSRAWMAAPVETCARRSRGTSISVCAK